MIDHVTMEHRDTKGDLYEYMLGKIASAGQNGQFRTPRHIIGLMVELVEPVPTDIMCDPAGGTCGFPVSVGEYLRRHYPTILTDASIERIAIIADHLWPEGSLFPIEPIHSWLDEQHRHGIWLRLLRESAVGTDTDLLNDFGIYGNRAVGMQLADPAGRTIRFILSFDFEKLRQAEAHWSRLAVYAIS